MAETWPWIALIVTLVVLLTIDLLVHRYWPNQGTRAALIWTVLWIGAGLIFNGFVWAVAGSEPAQHYLVAYLIEKSLSLDNLFVFLFIFQKLEIPHRNQHKALFWGVFGALIFRALFIFAGLATIRHWHWMIYVFGGSLLIAAIQAFRENPQNAKRSRLVDWLVRHLPVSRHAEERHFFVRDDSHWKITPLLVAVICLEISDILFAIDSVPAVISITQNDYIVYSSNAFAILGLRSLYSILAKTIGKLRYLHFGLAGVLGFTALKMLTSEWIHIPPWASVLVIVAFLGAAVCASLRAPAAQSKTPPPAHDADIPSGPRYP